MSRKTFSDSRENFSGARAALVVAHPGHELRVYGWLAATRPVVCVITDGSGRSNESRIGSSERLLASVGARRGPVFGRLTDAELYSAILGHDHTLFNGLADELAETFVRERVECVACDAAEGGHPGHDACRLVVDAAVRVAARETESEIAVYDFPLYGRPDDCPEELREASLWLRLDDEAFGRKLGAAREYREVAEEVEAALSGAGSVSMRANPDLAARSRIDTAASSETFRTECLRPVAAGARYEERFGNESPFYERYAERQVAAGHYARAIRYREHMLPLAEALRAHRSKPKD